MTIAKHSRSLLAAVCLSAGAAFAPHVFAQEAAQPAPPAAEAPPVTDQKLQSFAVALAEVEKVKQEYQQRLQQTESDEQQQELKTEAGQRMLQAVEGIDGISVDEYNQIIRMAQTDPDVAQRLMQIIGPQAE